MGKEKKRICLALGFVQAEDAITKIIDSNYKDKYEIVQNVRSKEALFDTIRREKYDVVILREDLSGNTDLIDIFKTIRSSSNNTQIIFFMNKRNNGDPFFIELFLFNIYDFVILPNIKLDEVFSFLEKPRQFGEIVNLLPLRAERIRNLIIEANKNLKAPLQLDEDGDIDEVFDINLNKNSNKKQEPEVIVKEVIKYIEKPIIREIIKEVPVPTPGYIPEQEVVTKEPEVIEKNSIQEEKINTSRDLESALNSLENESKIESTINNSIEDEEDDI